MSTKNLVQDIIFKIVTNSIEKKQSKHIKTLQDLIENGVLEINKYMEKNIISEYKNTDDDDVKIELYQEIYEEITKHFPVVSSMDSGLMDDLIVDFINNYNSSNSDEELDSEVNEDSDSSEKYMLEDNSDDGSEEQMIEESDDDE